MYSFIKKRFKSNKQIIDDNDNNKNNLEIIYEETNNTNDLLIDFDDKNIELFSFNDIKTVCRVVDVYDGDTCTIIFLYKDEVIKYKVRCYGYDSPEMRPSLKKENREEEIEKAKIAKEYFKSLVNYNDGLTYIHIHKFDKYGRLLGTFYNNENFEGKSINDLMIENGHGYSYFGGTKKK